MNSIQVQVGISKHFLLKSKFFDKALKSVPKATFVFACVSKDHFGSHQNCVKNLCTLILDPPSTRQLLLRRPKTLPRYFQRLSWASKSGPQVIQTASNKFEFGSILQLTPSTTMAMQLSMATHDMQITIHTTQSLPQQTHILSPEDIVSPDVHIRSANIHTYMLGIHTYMLGIHTYIHTYIYTQTYMLRIRMSH